MKFKLRLILFSIFICFGFSLFAQDFYGKIEYSVKIEGKPGLLVDQRLIDEQAKIASMTIKGTKSKFEMDGQRLRQVKIVDAAAKTTIDLLYVLYGNYSKEKNLYAGIKKDFKLTEVELAKRPVPNISYSNDTKVIAGLLCKKATITTWDENGNEYTAEVYYHEFPEGENMNFFNDFRDIKGVMMEYSFLSQEAYIVTFTATKFKKKKVKDSEFEAPANTVFYTLDEINKIKDRGFE